MDRTFSALRTAPVEGETAPSVSPYPAGARRSSPNPGSLSIIARLLDDRSAVPWILFPLLACAIAFLQSSLLLRPSVHLVSDMAGYLDRARALILGTPFRPYDLFYPPGTAYLLALLFKLSDLFTADSADGARGVPVLLVSATWSCCIALGTLATGMLSRVVFPSARSAPVAMLLAALYWPFAALTSFLMSEPLFIGTALFGYALSCSELLGRRRPLPALIGGLLLGFGCLVRGQGLLLVAALSCSMLAGLLFPALLRTVPDRAQRTGRLLCALIVLCGITAPILLHLRFASAAAGTPITFLASNDAFNLYLGQSRRGGVGALDPERGEYYLFFNNNSGSSLPFEPFEAVAGAVTDRALFFELTRSLWQIDPGLQLIRSLQNLRELFLVRPSWPLTAFEPRFTGADLFFQWLAVIIGIVPALGAITRDGRCRIVIGLPLLFLALSAAATTGQPRYLTPFLIFVIAAAAPAIRSLLSRSSNPDGSSDGVKDFRIGSCLVLLAWVSGTGIEMMYSRFHPPAKLVPIQERYRLSQLVPAPTPLGVRGWFTVSSAPRRGIANGAAEELQPFRAAEGVSLSSSGFSPTHTVTPTFSADRSATVTLAFPPESVTHAGFFLVDPDNSGRITVLRSGGRIALGQQLFPGKWVTIDLSAEDRAQGTATVELSLLHGSSVELSAVILYLSDPKRAPVEQHTPLQSAGIRPLRHSPHAATEESNRAAAS